MNKKEQIKEWFEKNFEYNIKNINLTKELYIFEDDNDKKK